MRKKFTAVLALWTSGCVSWQAQRAPLPQTPDNASGQKVIVELRSGTELVLFDARVVGDSIIGISTASAPSRGRVAIATSDVKRVSIRRFSVGRTVAAVVTIGVATLVIAGASAASSASSSNSDCKSSAAAPAPSA